MILFPEKLIMFQYSIENHEIKSDFAISFSQKPEI